MYVYHCDNEPIHDVIDGVLLTVNPQEVYEIPNAFHGRKFMEHKHFHGVVEVHTKRTSRGIEFMIEEAHVEASAKLLVAERATIDEYVRTQLEDRMQNGKPALPPGGRQKVLMKKYNVDLASYGIRPVGVLIETKLDPNVQALVAQNAELMLLIKTLLGQAGVKTAAEVGAGPVSPTAPVTPRTNLHVSPEDSDDGQAVTDANTAPIPPAPPSQIRVGHAPSIPSGIPNPTVEDLGGQVVDSDSQEVIIRGDADNPNHISGPAMASAPPTPPPLPLGKAGAAKKKSTGPVIEE